MKRFKLFMTTLMLMFVSMSAFALTETIDLAAGHTSDESGSLQITWSGASCSIMQDKANSPTAVSASYVAQPRWYASHVITFMCTPGMNISSIEIVCTSASYASVFEKSTFSNGATATVNGTSVTIIPQGDFTISMSAQSRISSIQVEYTQSGTTQPTDTTGTTQPTDTTGTNPGVTPQPTDTTGTNPGVTPQPTDTTGNPNVVILVDVLDQSVTGITSTGYAEFKNVYATTNASYSGQCAGGNSSIQLRSTSNNSGVVTTASAGIVSKIEVEWQSNTAAGRTLNVYGSHTAYSAATDLYNAATAGTLIGTIVMGESTSLTFSEPYEYVGFRSASGAMYLTSVSISWVSSSDVVVVEAPELPESTYFMDNMMVRIPTQDSTDIYYTLDGSEPTLKSSVYTKPFYIYTTTTVKAIAVKNGVASHVAEATYTLVPSYASLEALVSDTSLQSGTLVDVTFRNVLIDSIVVSGSGYRNGLFVTVNGQTIEFYCKDVPADWVAGGTIEGQLQCPWKLYKDMWELCPTSWNAITYHEPVTNTDGRPAGTEGWYKIVVENPLGAEGVICWMSHAYDFSTWTQPDTTSVVVPHDQFAANDNTYYLAYVRPGAGVAFAWMNFSTTFQRGDTVFLTCSDPRYDNIGYELLDSNESSIMNIYPEGDMIFTSYMKEKQPADTTGTETPEWYEVKVLPLDGILFSAIEDYTEEFSENYGANVRTETDEENVLHVYVKPGAKALIYLNPNYESNFVYDYSFFLLMHSSDSRYDGVYEHVNNSLSVQPTGDMTLSAELPYNKVVLTHNNACDAWAIIPEPEEGDDSPTIVEGELYYNDYMEEFRPYYVPRGMEMEVFSNVYDTIGHEFLRWECSDTTYNSTSARMRVYPTTDLTLKAIAWEKPATCPEGWYTITIPASQYVGFGMEEAYNPDNEWGYGEGVQRYDQEDGGMTLFVRPGAEFWLYINQKYDAAGEPLYGFNYDYFVTFASSDTTYNGKQEHFGNTLLVQPTGDMTLSVANVEYGYYRVNLATTNDDNVTYEPVFEEESSNQEAAFSVEETEWGSLVFVVRKGRSFKVRATVTNPDHEFKHWTAAVDGFEKYTSPLLEYTPTDDGLWIYAVTGEPVYYTVRIAPSSNDFTIDVEAGEGAEYNGYEDGYLVYVMHEGAQIALSSRNFGATKQAAGWRVIANGVEQTIDSLEFVYTATSDATIALVEEELFWHITLGNLGDDATFSMNFLYDEQGNSLSWISTEIDGTDTVNVAYVRKGSHMELSFNYYGMGNYLDYGVELSTPVDSLNGQIIRGGESLYYTPTSDFSISGVLKQIVSYYTVTLNQPDYSTYFELDYQGTMEELDSVPDNTRIFRVREGSELTISVGTEDFRESFSYWQSSDSLLSSTESTLTFVVTKDIVLTPVFEEMFWSVRAEQMTGTSFYLRDVDMDESFSGVENVILTEDEDGADVWYVRKGHMAELYFQYIGEENDYTYYSVNVLSNDSTLNGRTAECELEAIRFTPTCDTKISAETFYHYWNVLLDNNRYAEIEVLDSTLTEWVNDTTMQMLVKKGKSFRVGYYSLDEEKVLDHWSTGDTTQVLTYTPTSDMVLSMVLKDAFIYHTLTLTREDYFTYFSVDYDWSGNVTDEESEDGLIRRITVREGSSIYLQVGTEDELKGFAYWQSSDSAYNNVTSSDLTITMNNSLTLTPVFEDLYWMVTLPVMENMSFMLDLTPEQEESYEYGDFIEGETTGSKQIYYVRKGLSLDITPYYLDEMGNYDYNYLVTLNANDSAMGSQTVLSGRSATFMPQSDLYLSASAEFAYWKVTLEEVYNVVGFVSLSETLRVPGDTLDQLWVLKGESFQVKCEIYDEELMLDHWSTGDTAQVLTYTPTSDMTLSAILTERYTYNKVILVTPDSETRVFVDAYNSGTYREAESTVENEQVYLVREGERLAFSAETSSRIKEFLYWDIEYLAVDGSRTTGTSDYLFTAVHAEAYITRVTPVYESAYYGVRLLGADTLTIVVDEDYSSVTSVQRNYFLEYVTIDTITGMSAPVYYIHKGDSLTFTYEQPWSHPEYVFDHWISSAEAYNGSTLDPLCVKPASDMTLGVACNVGYWRIYIPETEGRIVDIFDAEEFNRPQEDAPMPRSAARVNGATDRNVFMTYEERDSIDTWFYYAKKNTRVVAVAVEMLDNPLFHLDHWVSDNDSVNGNVNNPVYFTPNFDMHLDYVTAKNTIVVGNDTIVMPDSISSEPDAKITIEVTEDKSVVIEIAVNEEGQTTTTMVFDSAQIANTGITSDISTLILEVENTNNIILADTIEDQVGFHFTGDELIITSNTYDESVAIDLRDTTAMLIIRAAQGLVGNGSNSLTIDGRLIVSSFGQTTLMAAPVRHIPGLTTRPGTPAISGFDTIIVSDRVAIQEVWYANDNGGQVKGDPANCRFNASQQSFGEVDMQASSFTPATTLVFSDGAFYTDYLEGNIDIATGLVNLRQETAVEPAGDHNYYDVLGRQLNGPQQGVYIHEGRVYLRY